MDSIFNPITQEDIENVRAEVEETGPILEEPPQKWIEVMRKWWKKLRDRRNWAPTNQPGDGNSELTLFYGHWRELKWNEKCAPKAPEK